MESFGQRRRFGGGGGGFGGRKRSFGYSQDKPVKEGEIYDIEIIEVGSRGDGIAKIQNFVIFIPGTQKGQKVRVKITQVRASSAVGEVVPEGGSQATEEVVAEGPEESESAESEEEETEEEAEGVGKEEPKEEEKPEGEF
jgi:predicted RNA-binding protein with TRAM domain